MAGWIHCQIVNEGTLGLLVKLSVWHTFCTRRSAGCLTASFEPRVARGILEHRSFVLPLNVSTLDFSCYEICGTSYSVPTSDCIQTSTETTPSQEGEGRRHCRLSEFDELEFPFTGAVIDV
uniref:Uncharacterized protein n=1 Tax=Grammatophora oceanica TaxID=210454 RepID=A0A7S1VNP7_9STRA|mmetsp:Transcript_51831/g.77386  ORF Transcript_51831/g.77386 Transcript_51831/m.77386 type:complete len:121 (+) Transcript_51831:1484-1846(+)